MVVLTDMTNQFLAFVQAAVVGRLPVRTSQSSGDPSFAILPQQSEDELVLSEVHTKLDTVVSFLQRDVGYSLLDDARPRHGGGVRLSRAAEANFADMAIAESRKAHTNRLPREEPRVNPEDVRQVIRFNAETAMYAEHADDLVLVWRFANLIAEGNPTIASKVEQESLYIIALKGIKLMHLCEFTYSDIVVTLAYASVYFKNAFGEIGDKMNHNEAAHVCALLVYLAHSFILDETCPLKCWQKHIFRKYCTLKVLDAALFRLFQLREFRLRITFDQERYALSKLLANTNEVDVILRLGDLRRDGPRRSGTSASAATSGGASGPTSGAPSGAASCASSGSVARPHVVARPLQGPARSGSCGVTTSHHGADGVDGPCPQQVHRPPTPLSLQPSGGRPMRTPSSAYNASSTTEASPSGSGSDAGSNMKHHVGSLAVSPQNLRLSGKVDAATSAPAAVATVPSPAVATVSSPADMTARMNRNR